MMFNEKCKAEGKHKIFCFNNGGNPEWLQAMAIADCGHVLATHVCSHEDFMRHDLGMPAHKRLGHGVGIIEQGHRVDWKDAGYAAHFGKGNWELVWVETQEVIDKSNLEFQEALEWNRRIGEMHERPHTEFEGWEKFKKMNLDLLVDGGTADIGPEFAWDNKIKIGVYMRQGDELLHEDPISVEEQARRMKEAQDGVQ